MLFLLKVERPRQAGQLGREETKFNKDKGRDLQLGKNNSASAQVRG